MRTERRGRRVIRDVVAAAAAFMIVFAVAYVSGRASIPVEIEAAADAAAIGEVPTGGSAVMGDDAFSDPAEASLESLQAQLAAMDPPAALLAATGAVEGRLVLDGGESVSSNFLPVGDHDDEELAMDVNARFSGTDATFTVVADALQIGKPKTESVSVVLSIQGLMFFSQAGMCTVELLDLGYTLEQSIYGRLSVPYFEGHLACDGVPELRSGEPLSFTAVFELRNTSGA
ncbi:MAG TPA: hypothetical protein VK960_09285 [Acidimicrobiia bacterium]|nr:hypothetical protein [Acidimicrobiia bacterium]